MKFFTDPQNKVYWLPSLLFLFLLSVFSLARFFLFDVEQQRRKALANTVALQASNSLEVFSADRKRALKDLVLSWPSRHPNSIDWFQTHASNIKHMMPGIYDIWWVGADLAIDWSISLADKNNLLGAHIGALGLDVNALERTGTASGLLTNNDFMSLYAIRIDPNDQSLGYVVASFDINTTLGVLVGDLIGPQFNFSLLDGSTVLLSHGALDTDGTVASVGVNFADRQWQLSLQSSEQKLQASQIIFWTGCLMSVMICLFFFWQLRNALQLTLSQTRYKAAGDAALDSILIYESVSDKAAIIVDFRLVDANRLANKRLHCDLKKPLNQLLSHQLSLMNVPELFSGIKAVSQTGVPFEHTLHDTSELFGAQWLKLQVVRADGGIAMTVRDITLRYTSQQELKKSEARFRRLVDGLNRDFVYSLNANNQLQFVSTSVTNILGYNVDDFVANSDNYLVSVPDNINQIRQQQMNGLKAEPYVMVYRSASQQQISIECNDSPVFDEQGNLVAIEGIGRDVTEDLILKQKIYYQANHDPLTGLLNRYAFDQKLGKIIQQIPAHYATATMCYIDMDQFKLINDTCGHQAGDQLLKSIANLLQQHCGEKGVLARVGGDEFCMILVELSASEVKQSMQRLLDNVSAFRFEWQNRVFHIGASIGLVTMDKHNLNATDIVKAADSACYMAKNNGRNQYVYHDNSESEIVFRNTELQLLTQVQSALDQDKFELYFQVIKPLDAAANQKVRYEILLRMFDENDEQVSPAIFIPVAERHGIMSRIDEWVFQHTIDLLEAHPQHLSNLDKCAINLSGASINSPSLMKKLLQRLKQTSFEQEKLCFEITETAAVTNLVKASNIIEEIRKLGCKFALDDFGAGMSSFTYLKNMPVDFIKIDGSFVKNMCNNPSDLATVKAIHEIANSMNKQTIAEFVGDAQTEAKLKELGVNYAQGFGIAKPAPFAEYLAGAEVNINAEAC